MENFGDVLRSAFVGALSLFVIVLLSTVAPIGFAFCVLLFLWGAFRFRRCEEGSYRQKEAVMLLIVGAIGFVCVLALKPSLHPPREAMARKHCQENLIAIGHALDMYAKANNGTRPRYLSSLYPDFYPQRLDLFMCPNAKAKAGLAERFDEWCSYEYNAFGTEWICRDKTSELHIPGGRNVLRPDGKVEFVKEAPPR